jgi:hypothetical protein
MTMPSMSVGWIAALLSERSLARAEIIPVRAHTDVGVGYADDRSGPAQHVYDRFVACDVESSLVKGREVVRQKSPRLVTGDHDRVTRQTVTGSEAAQDTDAVHTVVS